MKCFGLSTYYYRLKMQNFLGILRQFTKISLQFTNISHQNSYVFLCFFSKISLQTLTFTGNEIPLFPTFSRPGDNFGGKYSVFTFFKAHTVQFMLKLIMHNNLYCICFARVLRCIEFIPYHWL